MKSAFMIAAAILIATSTARLKPSRYALKPSRYAVAASVQGAGHADLVRLFTEWRAFQEPKVVDGVPDYTAGAMAAQQRELGAYQRRLTGIDTSGWLASQQVDWHIVRAEMNGLDFDHRVIRRGPATRRSTSASFRTRAISRCAKDILHTAPSSCGAMSFH